MTGVQTCALPIFQLDDNVDSAMPARLHGSPGTHRLTVWSKGKIVGKRDLYLRLGRPETITVPWREDVPIVPSPIVRTVTVASEPHSDPLRVVGGGLVGAGVVSLATAITLSISSGYASREANRSTPPDGGVETFSGTLSALAVVSWAATGVFLAAGVTMLVVPLSPKSKVALSPGLGNVVLSGSF